ncbi:MAG TPA: TlpA disulfide reductase family protein [Thermoanaerobaculia bacterium]|nr:TlpA disulfide reductase family protein [Thermoanaerobaculia bacterium]
MTGTKWLSRSCRPALTVAFVSSLLLFGCRDGASAGDPPSASHVAGTKAAFRLQTLEGRPLGPKDFPGQVVLVDFWATWCGPCHLQARILEDVYREYRGRGVQFLAADVGEEREVVRKFLQSAPIPYTVLLDPQNVADSLGINALPTLMVVDKKGRVSYFEPGISDGDTIRKLLKEAGV